MKKTFFMVGILVALSMTAFGAEVGSVTEEITITGTAVKGITITSSKDNIDFGRVLAGGTGATSPEITLTLTGETGQNVALKSEITGDGSTALSFDDTAKITDGEKVLLTGEPATKKFKVKYNPTEAGVLNATLTVTASYDDTDWTK